MEDNEILVSIKCLVYNHEPYLRQCLDGFVMQKTNFRFEAIVHDDASTDGSVAIIREYAEKYPHIIKPIYETENQYSKRDGSLTRIMNAACKGKYIAVCEGDDYWIDPLKLQKQVDFLESHKEYSMCFHRAKIKNEIKAYTGCKYDFIEDKDYTANELFKDWLVPTASMLFRKEIIDNNKTDKRIQSGDIILVLRCVEAGKVRGFKEYMSVYRVQNTGLTYNKEYLRERINGYVAHLDFVKEEFPFLKKSLLKNEYKKAYWRRFNLFPNLPDFIECFKLDPLFCIKKSVSKVLKTLI